MSCLPLNKRKSAEGVGGEGDGAVGEVGAEEAGCHKGDGLGGGEIQLTCVFRSILVGACDVEEDGAFFQIDRHVGVGGKQLDLETFVTRGSSIVHGGFSIDIASNEDCYLRTVEVAGILFRHEGGGDMELGLLIRIRCLAPHFPEEGCDLGIVDEDGLIHHLRFLLLDGGGGTAGGEGEDNGQQYKE